MPCAGATAGCQHLPGLSGGTEPSRGPFVEFTAAVLGWRGPAAPFGAKLEDGANASMVTAV